MAYVDVFSIPIIVPLILDRLRAAIEEQASKKPITKAMFTAAYYLKRRNFLQGLPSPILDKIVFSKIAVTN